MPAEMSALEAWANLGWVAKEYRHTHICTECREVIDCHCEDCLARWATCSECQQKQVAA